MSGDCPKCGNHCLECICNAEKCLRDLINSTKASPQMLKHLELRNRLSNLNQMERHDGSELVTEILEYLMDNAKFRDEE